METQKFYDEKLDRGISMAGTPFMLAKDISELIMSKLANNPSIKNHIYSSKIKEYVTKVLKQRNQDTIAESYTGYSKNSVTSINEEQLHNNKYDSKVSQTANTNQNSLQRTRIIPLEEDQKQEFSKGSFFLATNILHFFIHRR